MSSKFKKQTFYFKNKKKINSSSEDLNLQPLEYKTNMLNFFFVFLKLKYVFQDILGILNIGSRFNFNMIQAQKHQNWVNQNIKKGTFKVKV
jgi:hypothetical protein